MSHFLPYDGLHVTIMSPQVAERHARVAYNVPPEHGLGWKPYTVLVRSYGATAYKAFHSARELRRWLGPAFRVELQPHRRCPGSNPDYRAMRLGRIVSTGGAK